MPDLSDALASREALGADNPAGMAPAIPRVTDKASYDQIPTGSEYLDPTGVKKQKLPNTPRVTDAASYDLIPEGSEYLDPTGTKKQKPTSENVGLGTQILFDMASGDAATQKKILASFFGDDVRQDPQGLYVERDGKRMRPSSSGGGFTGGLIRGTADVATRAVPTLGALTGAALGSAAGPVSGVAGGALGYAAGKEYNRLILAIGGFGGPNAGLERLPGELAEGATFEAGGQLAGRAAGQIAAAAKYGGRYAAEALGIPWAMRKVGNVTPESVARWGPLADKNVNLPPQLAYPGAPVLPMLSSIGKKYDIDPVTPSLERYATSEIKNTAEALGIPRTEIGDPLKRTAEVDYTPAGEAMHRRYADMMTQSNADLDKRFAEAEAAARGAGSGAEVGRQSALAEAQIALDRNQTTARGILDAGWQDIGGTITQLRSGVAGENPGDLVRTMAGRITATRQALNARYQDLYGKWDSLYGNHVADISAVTNASQNFMRDLPDDIQRNHPALIRAIGGLEQADKDGVASDITTGHLRHIRSMLGDLANWQTLAPSFKNGQMKYFRGVIDQALHQNLPEQGAKMLDTLDKGYSGDFAPFHDPTMQKMVDWTEANMPPSAGTAAKTVLGAEAEPRAYIRDMVGRPVWDAVVGADMQAAMDASKSIYEGEVDGAKFIGEFARRDRSGVLGEYPPAVAAKMRQQAQYVNEITDGGKAPLPVAVKRGDRFTSAMQGIYEAAQRVDRLSKADPIKAMAGELKRIATERKDALRGVAEQYSTDPMGQILTNPNALVSQSAHRIIRDPQLLETAAKRFGPDSAEFKLLGRTYIKDVLTHPDVYGLSGVSSDLSKLTRAQQEQIFGAKADDVILFAQNVHDILKAIGRSDAGSSIIASTAVTHPASTPLPGMHKLAGIPTAFIRVPLSVVLDYTIRGYTNPAFFRFVSGALRGSQEEREAARDLIKRFTLGGGVAGAGVGSALASGPGDGPRGTPVHRDWRQDFQQRYAQ